MGRLQFFEIHDFSWCPHVVRDGLTDFLATTIETFDTYAPIRDMLFEAIGESGAERVIDLCSGGGGPWQAWSKSIPQLPPVVLTDKFPNRKAATAPLQGRIVYCPDPVDATAVPERLQGFRTIFTAAHHFPPAVVEQMIADAVVKKQPIGIFELTNRSMRAALWFSLSGLGVWLLTPKMKRLTWMKLLFTYVIPLIPFTASFDGVVSCLRTYKPHELRAMAQAPGYSWRTGLIAGDSGPITYLLGLPKMPSS